MDPDRRLLLGGGVLVAIAAVVSVLAHPEMPAEMATHWNASGDVDGTMSRELGLALLPVLALGTLGLFYAIPRIDPREDFESFRFAYDALALATVALVVWVHGLVVLVNLGYEFGILQGLAPAVGAIYVLAGYVTERAEQNWFVGVRTPWTLEDEQVWTETNQLVAQLFKVGGVVAAAGALVPQYAVALIVGPPVVAVVVSAGYSYYRYQGTA
ncbi:SdpI family protein [Halobacterium wangiae]|uniref:SdpI family protein n=1 Tax=Halobacterium wangiae TaxID=2902623 RepID=UPI001E29C3D9|nr:SdpI family protein [Halobacterium wangiae]